MYFDKLRYVKDLDKITDMVSKLPNNPTIQMEYTYKFRIFTSEFSKIVEFFESIGYYNIKTTHRGMGVCTYTIRGLCKKPLTFDVYGTLDMDL